MDRYNRLLTVKQLWDPDNLFWCHHCVGSDLVTHESTEPCFNPYSPEKIVYSSSERLLSTLTSLMVLPLLQFFQDTSPHSERTHSSVARNYWISRLGCIEVYGELAKKSHIPIKLNIQIEDKLQKDCSVSNSWNKTVYYNVSL